MAIGKLDKFKSTINRGVTTINVKTSSSLEKVKIKTHIESLNSEIKRISAAIGEDAYVIWVNGGKDFSSLDMQFVAMKELKDEVARLEVERDSIDEKGQEILGTKFDNAETSESAGEGMQEGSQACPCCGSVYNASMRFCVKCGQSLQ